MSLLNIKYLYVCGFYIRNVTPIVCIFEFKLIKLYLLALSLHTAHMTKSKHVICKFIENENGRIFTPLIQNLLAAIIGHESSSVSLYTSSWMRL